MKRFNKYYKEGYNFISGYEVKNGSIIVHYDNGELYETPYTIEKEKEILSLMENQIPNYGGHNYEYQNDIISCNAIKTMYLTLTGINLIFALRNKNISNYLLAGTFASLFLIYSAYFRKRIEKHDETEKYLLFLKNEKLINDEIMKQFNQNDEWVNDETLEANTMSINDLDAYSYKEILDMIEMIKAAKEQEKKLVLK